MNKIIFEKKTKNEIKDTQTKQSKEEDSIEESSNTKFKVIGRFKVTILDNQDNIS